jgi:hypothetical protein
MVMTGIVVTDHVVECSIRCESIAYDAHLDINGSMGHWDSLVLCSQRL